MASHPTVARAAPPPPPHSEVMASHRRNESRRWRRRRLPVRPASVHNRFTPSPLASRSMSRRCARTICSPRASWRPDPGRFNREADAGPLWFKGSPLPGEGTRWLPWSYRRGARSPPRTVREGRARVMGHKRPVAPPPSWLWRAPCPPSLSSRRVARTAPLATRVRPGNPCRSGSWGGGRMRSTDIDATKQRCQPRGRR